MIVQFTLALAIVIHLFAAIFFGLFGDSVAFSMLFVGALFYACVAGVMSK